MLVDLQSLQQQLARCEQLVVTEDYEELIQEVIELDSQLRQFFNQLPTETLQKQQSLSEKELKFMEQAVDFIQSHTMKFSDISDEIKTQIVAINNKSKVKQAYQR